MEFSTNDLLIAIALKQLQIEFLQKENRALRALATQAPPSQESPEPDKA